MFKRLFVWLEGPDDVRFFDAVLKPLFQKAYDWVESVRYAELKTAKVIAFLNSIKAMGADYIYLADINQHPCVTARKENIQQRFPNLDTNKKVIVVIKEIESWYLAGLDMTSSKQLGVAFQPTTDGLSKEQFNALAPQKFDSRIDFMVEILKHFSIPTAKQNNRSFAYFLNKHIGQV